MSLLKRMERIVTCPYSPNGERIPSKNIGLTLFESIREHSTSIAMEDITSGQKITYQELGWKSQTMARHLLDLGCKSGDVSGIFSPSSIEWVIVTLAAWRIGAVAAGVSPLLTVGELKHQLSICKPKFIYTVSAIAKVAVEFVAAASPCQIIVKGGFKHCINLESLFKITDQLPELPTFDQLKVKPDDPALIMFSSGTTGPQKAVLITHYNIQSQIPMMSHALSTSVIFPQQVLFLPFSHIGGAINILVPFVFGYKTFLLPRFDLRPYLQCIQDNKLDSIFIVPAVAILLAKRPEVDEFQLSHLKHIVCVAAPLGVDTEDLLITKFPRLTFVQGYGMTETCGGCTIKPRHDTRVGRKPGSVGVPVVNVKIKIVDIATGTSLGPNERGELCLKSPAGTPGYKDNPEATAALIDKDGWIHTGDLGYYDEDGYFYIVDRLKEVIKYNAYQVAPAELEAVLMSHPQVADAGVVGIPHPTAGELPTAWVVLKSGVTVTTKELDEFVSENVAPFKKLRGGIQFVAAIPRGPSGKILRRLIKEAMVTGKL